MTELLEFDGAVECDVTAGAINLILRGLEHGGGLVGAMFAGVPAGALASLPPRLHEVRLFEVEPVAGSRQLRLQSREAQLEVPAKSLQLHRDVSGLFFAAVPPCQVRLGRRLSWAILLTALRIPGVANLLATFRGRR